MKKKLCSLMVMLSCIVFFASACNSQNMFDKSQAAEEGQEEMIEIKAGMVGVDIKTACLIMAKELGYAEEEGVDLKFEKISSLADGVTALSEDKLDLLPYGVIPSCSFISQGVDVTIIGGTIAEGSEAIVARGNKEHFKEIEDLRGKKIGCFRMETGHMVMKGLVREAGMVIDQDVEFVYLDSAASIVEAVKKGEVDVGFVNSGYGYVAETGGAEVAFQVGAFQADFPCCRQSASTEAMDNKRAGLVKLMMAELRAYDTYLNDHETTIETLTTYSGQEADYVQAVIYGNESYENAMIISMDPQKNAVCDFYEVMKANGDIDPQTNIDIADHIDTSIYQEALMALNERDKGNKLYAQLLEEFKRNNNGS